MKRKTVPLRALVMNGHVGIPIRNGAVQWLLRRCPKVDIIFAQEIRDADVLRNALGSGWLLVPYEQPHEGPRKEGMTYVALRRSRFQVLSFRNDDITYGERYPRRMTVATARDRRSGWVLTMASVHCAPLGAGLRNGDPAQRLRQTRQLGAYADFLVQRGTDEILLAGGDFNQALDAPVPPNLTHASAHTIFSRPGLDAASRVVKHSGEVKLMELFVDRHPALRVVRRRAISVPVPGMDHESVFVGMRVRKAH